MSRKSIVGIVIAACAVGLIGVVAVVAIAVMMYQSNEAEKDRRWQATRRASENVQSDFIRNQKQESDRRQAAFDLELKQSLIEANIAGEIARA